MVRPKMPRNICGELPKGFFKPNGVPLDQLEKIRLSDDEIEALRLVDLLGKQQQVAAVEMHVSRQTLAIILKAARRKVVGCLFNGHALALGNSSRHNTEKSGSD